MDKIPPPSLHLHTEEEAGRAASPFAAALRRNDEFHITILRRSSIHLSSPRKDIPRRANIGESPEAMSIRGAVTATLEIGNISQASLLRHAEEELSSDGSRLTLYS